MHINGLRHPNIRLIRQCLIEQQANTAAFRGSGNSATSGNSSSALTAGGAPSIASSAQVLESVHSKFFEMLLMLNGTSDVPQAVER